jgi:membrane associated rhomboid family serine protease
MPFGAATLILAAPAVAVYFFLSAGAAYPQERLVLAGALGADTLPFGAATYLFVHAGPGHLLENLLGIVLFGLLVEAALSFWDCLAVFFLAGVAGGLAFLLVSPQMKIIGASAGIVGLAVAGLLSDPRRGVLCIALAALLVNWAAPFAAQWLAEESSRGLELQKQSAQSRALELYAQQRPDEAQEQLEIARQVQERIDAQAQAKKKEEESQAGDAAHAAGALAGALYVVAFRKDKAQAWVERAKRGISAVQRR